MSVYTCIYRPVSIYLYLYERAVQDVQYYNAKKVVIDSSLQALCVYLYFYVSVCIYNKYL